MLLLSIRSLFFLLQHPFFQILTTKIPPKKCYCEYEATSAPPGASHIVVRSNKSDFPTAMIDVSDAISTQTTQASTCVLISDGTVRCAGSDEHGVIAQGGVKNGNFYIAVEVIGLTGVGSLHCGPKTCCVVLAGDSGARCWGYNGYSNIGMGTTDTSNKGSPTPVAGFESSGVVSIGVSTYATWYGLVSLLVTFLIDLN